MLSRNWNTQKYTQCNQKQRHKYTHTYAHLIKLIDAKKKWIASDDHQHHHWIVEIKTDLVKYFELHILRMVLMVLLHPTHSLTMDTASTEVFANFLLMFMTVCFLSSYFTFYRCGIRKKKKKQKRIVCNCDIFITHLVGWLLLYAMWMYCCAFCSFLSFSLSIFHNVYYSENEYFE